MRLSVICLLLTVLFGYTIAVLSDHLAPAQSKQQQQQSSKFTIDLLQHMGGWNGSDPSVQPIPAANTHSTALMLSGDNRHLEVSPDIVQRVMHLIEETEEFTILVAVKQRSLNVGTIFSIASKNYRYLELESSGRRDELRLHYYAQNQRILTQVFPYRIADNEWHQIALTVTNLQHVHLLLDCSFTYERPITPPLDRGVVTAGSGVEAGGLHVWVGQRDDRATTTTSFKGAIEYLKLVSSAQGYVEQCPYANVACPTCSQFNHVEHSVVELYTMVESLNKKLLSAESRLTELESCECMQSCTVGDKRYRDGETWQRDHCTKCTCRGGDIECETPKCPALRCKNPVMLDGHCCPVCLSSLTSLWDYMPEKGESCYFNHNHYGHGEGFNPRPCRKCTCRDGKMACERSPRVCPKLDCPRSEQEQGECCPYCAGTDYCAAGNTCHENATCRNLDTKYICQCKEGFVGLGEECIDRDECSLIGGHNGHHCHGNAVCVNTVGSFKCECKQGYIRLDEFSCREHNECDSGAHQCSPHAECLNTEGSYVCHCAPGYHGDGYTCQPICEQGCENGGTCQSPGVCQCRPGFAGHSCQSDINECTQGLAKCLPNSVCVNIPGSFYCQCKEGYHSNYPDNRKGALCKDVNECQGWGQGHRCPLGTVCHNTEGSFTCVCVDIDLCEGSCQADGTLYKDGTEWRPTNDKCSTCICRNGIVECTPKTCDCSRRSDHDSECCPQCRQRQSTQCRHQELPLMFQDGQMWTYQCQTCQCLDGEIDCWAIECPALSCTSRVKVVGDCCPSCLVDDPCAYEEIVSRLGKPKGSTSGEEVDDSTCMYDGKLYTPQDEWKLEWDACTTCKCKRGHICCDYNATCRYDTQRFMDQLDHLAASSRPKSKRHHQTSPNKGLLDVLKDDYEINLDDSLAANMDIVEALEDELKDRPRHRTRNKNKNKRKLGDRHKIEATRALGSRKERKKLLRQAARRRKQNLKSLELLSQRNRLLSDLAAAAIAADIENKAKEKVMYRTADNFPSSSTPPPSGEVDNSGYGLYDSDDSSPEDQAGGGGKR